MKWLLIWLCYCVLRTRGYGHYQWNIDNIGKSDKVKMISITEEIVIQANLKLRQIAAIRDEHSQNKDFEIGLVMGNIREKYRRMLETYREMRDKNNGRSFFVPNSIWQLRPIHYIVAMEHVHALETDIDKLIHVLESIISPSLHPDTRYIQPHTTRRKVTRPSIKREGNPQYDSENEEEKQHRLEEELKRSNREKQLLRRVGATGVHTSRQRFQQHWPVEDSWRLGQYGDMDIYNH